MHLVPLQPINEKLTSCKVAANNLHISYDSFPPTRDENRLTLDPEKDKC